MCYYKLSITYIKYYISNIFVSHIQKNFTHRKLKKVFFINISPLKRISLLTSGRKSKKMSAKRQKHIITEGSDFPGVALRNLAPSLLKIFY